ncbi:1,4-dihydroxy-6-naphthoate synthase [Chlamydia crocodili]|uniref:1,4-dihydroxy-6-naphtoate synthase n=1 Tax=Chlamydia crocodili TaxID=2766982 RepID=A0ABX8CIC7_9CHLA|nr:1,4-dihydroxy-6-naphthoate synthase [Chlamydia crocodili]QVE48927.1 1,4-dihydroxy-6-naphthoate synthase [Chlamydia crocodili]
MILSAAFSPCPNDIFLFRSFLERHEGFSLLNQITIADIATLNELALQHRFSLIKISAALFPKVADNYTLMEVGTIIGYGVGPLVLASDPIAPLKSIATPGETTTAHLLCKIFYPDAKLIPMKYSEILASILRNDVNAGVIIHEERFSYNSQLFLRADLGKLWEERTQLPLPLGCLVVSKTVPQTVIDILTLALRKSLFLALKDPEGSENKALEYSRNKDTTVIRKFIDTYVNDETLVLSNSGKKSLYTLSNYVSCLI